MKNKQKYAWKCLKKGMKSANGNEKWKKGEWKEFSGKLELCQSGFHASHLLVDAIQYVTPEVIAKVEYGGRIKEQDDKFVCSKMRVVETYKMTKRKWVEFAIYSAKQCLNNFEKEYPDDKRPREAIEAAQRWLKNPTKANQGAARSAAWSARSAAWSAAGSAAGSAARSAAWSARSAARSAAGSAAGSAAWSAAWSAAGSAARSAMKKKLEKKLLEILRR